MRAYLNRKAYADTVVFDKTLCDRFLVYKKILFDVDIKTKSLKTQNNVFEVVT